jgi:hypothetical protein
MQPRGIDVALPFPPRSGRCCVPPTQHPHGTRQRPRSLGTSEPTSAFLPRGHKWFAQHFPRSLPKRVLAHSCACLTIAFPYPMSFLGGGLCTITPPRSRRTRFQVAETFLFAYSPRTFGPGHRDPTSRSVAAEWPGTRTSPLGPNPSPM